MSIPNLEVFVPLALSWALGHALLWLIAPAAAATAVERWAFAFLLGTGSVSLLVWWLSPVFVYVRAVWTVTIAILTIVTAALFVKSRRSISPLVFMRGERWTIPARALAVALITLCVWVLIVSLVTPLGWDGLINFEFKARIGFLNEPSGVIPVSYFADDSRTWSNQKYPLLVPAAEGWLYQWVGEPNQAAIKPLFPLFYLSLVALVYGAVRKELSRTWALAACLGFALIPAFPVGPGGATTGYADLPLAAIVFGAVVSTRAALRPGARDHMALAAVLSALAAWTKMEGLCLAACLAGSVILARLVSDSRPVDDPPISTRLVVLLIVAPLVLIGPWWGFCQVFQAVPNGAFMSVTAANVTANLSRLPMVAGLMSQEFLRAGRWAALWPAFAIMVALCFRQLRRPSDCVVTVMVVAPLLIYMFMYTLSSWPDLNEHISTSLPRLLLPLAAIAWLGTVGSLRDALNRSERSRKSEQFVVQSAALT
ncbi:MAG: hypothetical protein ACRD1Q_17645 [Vicinamibacterales bacterium]